MITQGPPSYPEVKSNTFNEEIFLKKEFHDIKDTNVLSEAQQRGARFENPLTNYDEMLLFHAMGTGKTRSA